MDAPLNSSKETPLALPARPSGIDLFLRRHRLRKAASVVDKPQAEKPRLTPDLPPLSETQLMTGNRRLTRARSLTVVGLRHNGYRPSLLSTRTTPTNSAHGSTDEEMVVPTFDTQPMTAHTGRPDDKAANVVNRQKMTNLSSSFDWHHLRQNLADDSEQKKQGGLSQLLRHKKKDCRRHSFSREFESVWPPSIDGVSFRPQQLKKEKGSIKERASSLMPTFGNQGLERRAAEIDDDDLMLAPAFLLLDPFHLPVQEEKYALEDDQDIR